MLPSNLTFSDPVWDDSVNQNYLEGRQALEEGLQDLAITSFSLAKKQLTPSHPYQFLLEFFLGLSFQQKKRTVKYYQSLGHVGRQGISHHVATTTEIQVPCWSKALKHLQTSLELNHSFIPAHFLRGQAYETAGNISLAFQDYLFCWISDPHCTLYLQYASRLFRENPSQTFDLKCVSSSLETLCQSVREGNSAFVKYFALKQLSLIIKGMGLVSQEELLLMKSTLSGVARQKVGSYIPIPFSGDPDARIRVLAGELLRILPV